MKSWLDAIAGLGAFGARFRMERAPARPPHQVATANLGAELSCRIFRSASSRSSPSRQRRYRYRPLSATEDAKIN